MKKKIIFVFIVLIGLSIAGLFIFFKEKTVYLSDIEPTYSTVGYYDVCLNKDYEGNPLSLKVNGSEQTFEKGIFAHAYSTIVYDDLKKSFPTKFSTYMGINKTAFNNPNTKVKFFIYFDQQLVFSSEDISGSSDAVYFEMEANGVNRITLVIDSLDSNANDHGAWCAPLLTYKGGKLA